MTTEQLAAPFELKALADTGAFDGYASLFGRIDRSRDTVAPGAFQRTLADWRAKGRMPALLWQHDAAEPIGAWREMHEDTRGLYVAGELFIDAIPRARQAHALLKGGGLSGLSIGFRTVDAETDAASGVRRLAEVELFEVSLVTFPALAEARVATVKAVGRIATIREFEAFLRDAGGFSRTAARAIARDGYKAAPEPRDEDGGLEPLVAAHQRRLAGLTSRINRG